MPQITIATMQAFHSIHRSAHKVGFGSGAGFVVVPTVATKTTTITG